jgi:hypothetical protein
LVIASVAEILKDGHIPLLSVAVFPFKTRRGSFANPGSVRIDHRGH